MLISQSRYGMKTIYCHQGKRAEFCTSYLSSETASTLTTNGDNGVRSRIFHLWIIVPVIMNLFNLPPIFPVSFYSSHSGFLGLPHTRQVCSYLRAISSSWNALPSEKAMVHCLTFFNSVSILLLRLITTIWLKNYFPYPIALIAPPLPPLLIPHLIYYMWF